jgi:hypothetical protein
VFKLNKKGISVGDQLIFSLDQSIKATVVDDSHIELDGKIYTLSGATLALLEKRGVQRVSVQGTKYWMFGGVAVAALADDIDNANLNESGQ